MDSDQGKLFIGGISWETDEDRLKDYFSQYGDVLQTVVMREKTTGRPRGFGFVVFSDPSVLDRVLQDKHSIDGRTVCFFSFLPSRRLLGLLFSCFFFFWFTYYFSVFLLFILRCSSFYLFILVNIAFPAIEELLD